MIHNRRQILDAYADTYPDPLIVCDGFDAAILGVTHDGRVVYETAIILRSLRIGDGLSHTEAQEYFDFNIAGSIIENGPIYMTLIHSL